MSYMKELMIDFNAWWDKWWALRSHIKPIGTYETAVDAYKAGASLFAHKARWWDWVQDNALVYGDGRGQTLAVFIPVDSEDEGCSIEQVLQGKEPVKYGGLEKNRILFEQLTALMKFQAPHNKPPTPMQLLGDMQDGMEPALQTYVDGLTIYDSFSLGGIKDAFRDGWMLARNQKPATAKETASVGILAAAQECEELSDCAGAYVGQSKFQAIIAKHCVDALDVHNLKTDLSIATARAANLQAELESLTHDPEALANNMIDRHTVKRQAEAIVMYSKDLDRITKKLADMTRACEFYKESRDELLKKLIKEG